MVGSPIQDVRRCQAVTNNLFAKILRNHHITVSDSKTAFQRHCELPTGRGLELPSFNPSGSGTVPEMP